MEELKYKLGEGQDEKLDPKDKVIEKHGNVVKFTLREMEDADKINKKNLKEIDSQLSYHSAILTNIEENNKYGPEVKEMDNEKRYVVHLYQESYAMKKMLAIKKKELEEAIALDAKEAEEIAKQIPEIGGIPSPFQAEENSDKQAGEKVETSEELKDEPKQDNA